MSVYPNELVYPSLAQMACVVEAWLANASTARISERSRFRRLCRIVSACAGTTVNPGEPNYDELVIAIREISELWFVIENLREDLLSHPYVERLQRTSKDEMVPVGGKANTPGRNAQFELFVAAILRRGGFALSTPDEAGADWTANTQISTWSVECKRVKRENSLEGAIRTARDQINDSAIGGVILLDLSVLFDPETSTRKLDRSVPDEAIIEASNKRDQAFLAVYRDRIFEWIRGSLVGLVVFSDVVVRPAARTPTGEVPWATLNFWSYLHYRKSGSSGKAHFEEFESLFSAGLPDF